MPLLRRLAGGLAACLALAPVAQAWGPLGHSVVAALAQRQLSPAAEAEVERLLAPDHTRSLAEVANWAVRPAPARGRRRGRRQDDAAKAWQAPGR